MQDRSPGFPTVDWPGLFRVARAQARAAAERHQARTRRLALGSLALDLRFLGTALERCFSPALAALAPAARPSDLTVWLIDSRERGLPPPPSWPLPIAEKGPGRRYSAADGNEFFFEAVGHTWHLFDRTAREAYFWTADAAGLPVWDIGEPMRTLFAWFLDGTGFIPVHAGAVGDARGALLLIGPGGSGKSSTVLSCRGGKLGMLGDDFVLVDSAAANVHALYASAKLNAEGLARFADLAPLALNPDRRADEKAVFALGGAPAARGLPIAAIVLPRVAARGGGSRFTPASPAEALRALAPSTLLLLPGAGARALAKLGRIVESAPVFRLELGPDRAEVAASLDALLDEALRAQPPGARRSA